MGYAGIMADIKTGLRKNAGNCEQIEVPEDHRPLLNLIANQPDYVLISRSFDHNRNIHARLQEIDGLCKNSWPAALVSAAAPRMNNSDRMTVANARASEQFAGLVDHIVGEVQISVTALLCDTFDKTLPKAAEQSIALVHRQMIGYSSRLSDHMANAKSLKRGSHTAGTIAYPTHRHVTSDQPVSQIRIDGFWPSEQLC
jgi:hypothetical protein